MKGSRKSTRQLSFLSSLDPTERAQVLDQLLRNHPDLRADVEQIAEQMLSAHDDREAVATQVSDGLLSLQLTDLAGRAGRQPGGGYVEPHEAAYEMISEHLQPFLDDLTRRARSGTALAATEIGHGLLLGLSICRSCRDDNKALTHAGMPDTVDDLAQLVIDTMSKKGIDVDCDRVADECSEWLTLAHRT